MKNVVKFTLFNSFKSLIMRPPFWCVSAVYKAYRPQNLSLFMRCDPLLGGLLAPDIQLLNYTGETIGDKSPIKYGVHEANSARMYRCSCVLCVAVMSSDVMWYTEPIISCVLSNNTQHKTGNWSAVRSSREQKLSCCVFTVKQGEGHKNRIL